MDKSHIYQLDTSGTDSEATCKEISAESVNIAYNETGEQEKSAEKSKVVKDENQINTNKQMRCRGCHPRVQKCHRETAGPSKIKQSSSSDKSSESVKQVNKQPQRITLADFNQRLHNYTCIVCNEVFYEPQILDCGHSFCAYCIFKWLKIVPSCPMCRKDIRSSDQVKPDKNSEKIIKNVYKEMKAKYKIERRAHELRRKELLEEILHSREDLDDDFDESEYVVNPLEHLRDFEEFYEDIGNMIGSSWLSMDDSETDEDDEPTIIINNTRRRRHGQVIINSGSGGNIHINTGRRRRRTRHLPRPYTPLHSVNSIFEEMHPLEYLVRHA